ncbi:MAG: DUF2769 domain-containing protein [Patescibacteria group bacterium]|nr:DUF2769 domain-containing protein [Patescibacteria group bacterium]
MAKVIYNEGNLKKCQCPKCPVEMRSACVEDKLEEVENKLLINDLPLPEEPPELYCAKGRALCSDLSFQKPCVCPTCPVWQKDKLHSRYYCFNGNAEENS